MHVVIKYSKEVQNIFGIYHHSNKLHTKELRHEVLELT